MSTPSFEIVADANMPLVAEYFGTLGHVRRLTGTDMTPDSIKNADIMLVRSTVRIDAQLLKRSRVKFVGTATSGFDHVDTDYLRQKKIGFAYAPGSNANSVAEYIVAALLTISEKYHFSLRGKTVGVIGVGHVGSRVATLLQTLDMHVLQNDPPRAEKTKSTLFVSLDDLMSCDVITLHTPLTTGGAYPTYHLFDALRFEKLNSVCVFINTSRGAVVETGALKQAIRSGKISHAVLDVWEHEPNIDHELIDMVDVATPHIAGYSFDGKVKGTQMLYDAVCDFFNVSRHQHDATVIQQIQDGHEAYFDFEHHHASHASLSKLVRSCYDIQKDDVSLRKMLEMAEGEQGDYFRQLRKNYAVRPEFFHTNVTNVTHKETQAKLRALGFKVLI